MELKQCIHKGKTKSVWLVDGKAVKVFEPGYSKTDVLYEALNTARVEDAGMDIPDLLSVEVLDDGRWAIVSEYIEGKTLAALMDENPDKTEDYLDKMADLQIEINRKTNPLLTRLKDKLVREIIDGDALDDAVKYNLLTKLQGMPRHTKLCHGDYQPDNIIVDKNGKWHVIDWVHATQGNASADIARTCLLLELRKSGLAETYMKLFCEKTNTKMSYVREWMPIIAAAELQKKRPEERKLLELWTNSLNG